MNKVWMSVFLLICACSNNKTSNINSKASLPDTFEYSFNDLKAITTFINKQSGTMSTLYGNQLALQKAIGFNKEMVAGEVFTLVTWKQQADAHWFGANIPGDLQSVEVLETTLSRNEAVINYKLYEGKNLALNTDSLHRTERIKFILVQRPSVMP
jgi:hypothetical protein